MSTLTQLTGDAAAPHVFDHKDKTGRLVKSYKLRLIDDTVHAEWEKEQLRRAREFERGNKDMLTPAEFKERLDAIGEKYHGGQYSLMSWFARNATLFADAEPATTGAPTAKAQALASELGEGMTLLSSLIFGCSVGEMRKLMLDAAAEVSFYVGLIIRESLPTDPPAAAETASEGAAVPNG